MTGLAGRARVRLQDRRPPRVRAGSWRPDGAVQPLSAPPKRRPNYTGQLRIRRRDHLQSGSRLPGHRRRRRRALGVPATKTFRGSVVAMRASSVATPLIVRQVADQFAALHPGPVPPPGGNTIQVPPADQSRLGQYVFIPADDPRIPKRRTRYKFGLSTEVSCLRKAGDDEYQFVISSWQTTFSAAGDFGTGGQPLSDCRIIQAFG
jgi:hypothetical protein